MQLRDSIEGNLLIAHIFGGINKNKNLNILTISKHFKSENTWQHYVRDPNIKLYHKMSMFFKEIFRCTAIHVLCLK